MTRTPPTMADWLLAFVAVLTVLFLAGIALGGGITLGWFVVSEILN